METTAPASVGGFILSCASVNCFSRDFFVGDEKPANVACRWHEGEMSISSRSARDALNYALVFARAAAWTGNFRFRLGTAAERRIVRLLGEAFPASLDSTD